MERRHCIWRDKSVLLLKRGADIRARDNAKQKILYAAARTSEAREMATWPLDRSGTNARDKIGQTPLHAPTREGDSRCG
jgi:hypothetical protein